MDLKSNMAFTGKREPYVAQYKAGVDSAGLLKYVDITINADVGWSVAEALSMAETIPFTQNAYHSVSWNLTPVGIITDKPRGTATRAPGTTQGHAIIGMYLVKILLKIFVKGRQNSPPLIASLAYFSDYLP